MKFKNKEKNKTNQKGITLIALIITIIVMLILVGVCVAVALNGGLFTTAKKAVDETQIAIEREQLLSITLGALSDDVKIDLDKLDEAIKKDGTFEGTNGTYTSVESGNVYIVTENGNITKSIEYSIGDEVTVGGERFFVIEESDISDSTVTLLAKYNLNKAGTVQANVTASEYSYGFSSTNYWYDSETDTYETDLNTLEVPEGVTSVITIARNYGKAKGGEGRALTYEEAVALQRTQRGILYANDYDVVDGSLTYWLGTASKGRYVWHVGMGSVLSYFYTGPTDPCGIRPVITVPKSLVSTN